MKCGLYFSNSSFLRHRAKQKKSKMRPTGTHALLTRWLVLSMIDVLNSSPIVNGKAARNSERKTNFFFFSLRNRKTSASQNFSFFSVMSDQFPFAVAFSTRPQDSEAFLCFCGGSLITQSFKSSWAISASHCFLDL